MLSLVDVEAYAALEAYLRQDPGASLAPLAQRFYEFYPDEYDFLLFVTAEGVANTGVSAAFTTVNRPAIPGTGLDEPTYQGGYGSRGRLKGAMGSQGGPDSGFPPFDHELLHYYGAYLSPELGFQYDPDFNIASHWGFVSVHGQLGGFDASTLRCETPADALPPNCTPDEDGTTHYQTGAFAPNTNSFNGVDFAPLELYVMGLIAKNEVPSMTVMEGPRYLESTADFSLVAAENLAEITMDDIVALHGERALTPEEERHFEVAFVLVSKEPAGGEILEQTAEWAAIWGARVPNKGSWTSFAHKTGNRMTLSTEIGRRRTDADPAPLPPVPETCDIIAQDCGDERVGCYGGSCFNSKGRSLGAVCEYTNDCAPGSTCVGSVCQAYCSEDPSSEKACETLCPGASLSLTNPDSGATEKICRPS